MKYLNGSVMIFLRCMVMMTSLIALLSLSGCVYKHETKDLPVKGGDIGQVNSSKLPANASSEHQHVKAIETNQSSSVHKAGSLKQRESMERKPAKLPTKPIGKHKAVIYQTGNITLDVLTKRLKQSDAIGIFTKLAIRSDIMDLKDDIQTYKRKSELQSKLEGIRARFDGLLMKIMALLEADPDLSRDLYSARESIWESLLGVKT